jgi:hypothetical protein
MLTACIRSIGVVVEDTLTDKGGRFSPAAADVAALALYMQSLNAARIILHKLAHYPALPPRKKRAFHEVVPEEILDGE